MLVVSRKKSESIVLRVKGLSEPIRILVADIRGDRARIGIEAHRETVEILRSELVEESIQGFQEIPDVVSSP